MGRLLFLVFLIVPLIEIALFVIVGNAIGLWPTLLGVLVTALAGSFVLRIQGLALFNEIRQTMAQGMLPARALAEGMMVGIAGVLLLTPGYFTDLCGLLLLVPPVRAAIYGFLKSRIRVIATGPTGYRGSPGTGERPDSIELDDSDWRRH